MKLAFAFMRASKLWPILVLWGAVLLAGLSWAGGAATTPVRPATPVLRLTPAATKYQLGPYAQFLLDSTGRLSISEVSSPRLNQRFRPMETDSFNLGHTEAALWLRFTVAGGVGQASQGTEAWLLTLNQPTALNADLYTRMGSPDTSGQASPWRSSPTLSRGLDPLPKPNRHTVFRLLPVTEQPRTYYLKLTARASIMAAPRIWSPSAFFRDSRLDMLLLGAYCGTLLAMALYNLFLFFNIKDKSYLWYVLHIVSILFFFLGLNGLLQDCLGMLPRVVHLNLPLYGLGCAFLLRGFFARSFLMTRATLPRLDRLLLLCAWLVGFLPVLLTLPQLAPWPALLVSVATMAWPLLLFYLGLVRLRAGFKPARFFLLAYFFTAITSMFVAWTMLGWMPFMVWNMQAQQIGYVLEAILLSIALGDRINTLRLAKASAQQALEVSEERYRKLLEAAPDPMAVYDQGGGLTYLNPAFTRVFGWEVQDLDGKEESFVPVKLGDQEHEALKGVFAGQEFSNRETLRLTKAGASIEVSASASLLSGPGEEAQGAVVTFRDISQRKAAHRALLDQQKQLRKLTMDLTASEERQRKIIAQDLHDTVSQNLAAVLLNLTMARDQTSEPETGRELEQACSSLNQALLETRSLTFEISPPVLYDHGLAAALEWLAESIGQRHGLRVHFMEKSPVPPLNENLSVTLFRAARELLINAAKHSGAGQAEMSIQMQDSQVLVEVTDNGAGFDPNLGRTGSPQGFGLFSIRERLGLLGGGMTIESPPADSASGTRVTLRAPLEVDNEPAKGQ